MQNQAREKGNQAKEAVNHLSQKSQKVVPQVKDPGKDMVHQNLEVSVFLQKTSLGSAQLDLLWEERECTLPKSNVACRWEERRNQEQLVSWCCCCFVEVVKLKMHRYIPGYACKEAKGQRKALKGQRKALKRQRKTLNMSISYKDHGNGC